MLFALQRIAMRTHMLFCLIAVLLSLAFGDAHAIAQTTLHLSLASICPVCVPKTSSNLHKPTTDRGRRRSCAPGDHQELPHRGRTRRTEDPGRCSDVPSSPVSDAKCCQKTESLFAKPFKSLLQQNRHIADIRGTATFCPLLDKSGY